MIITQILILFENIIQNLQLLANFLLLKFLIYHYKYNIINKFKYNMNMI